MDEMKLVFVYNADSGLLNAAKDFMHRLVSPQTYQCNLCAVTYSNTGMRSEWRRFIDDLAYPVEILHKDEFNESYSFDNPEFPSAFKVHNEEISYFLTVEEMNEVGSVNELMDLVREKVSQLNIQNE